MFRVLDFAAMGDGQIELLLRMIDEAFDRKSSPRQAAKRTHQSLWLMDGHPLIGGEETEIIVSKFEFAPWPQ